MPTALLAYAYAQLLTGLGAVTVDDWTRGPAWLAVSSAPLVLTVTLALFAPLCDDEVDK